jgi:UDP:flavonoid glycosyltransferase YjiC (YdhE family)
MASVLIAWELGEAYGHLATCLRLAEGLRRRGHTVVLALKDVRLPAMQVAAPGVTVVPAPLTPQYPADRVAPVNYAGVLLCSGFAQAHDVAARLAAWQGLIELARAEVLVADHAPTALLAAHLAGIAHLAIGNGFAVPPAHSPWPSIRPWEDVSEAALVAAETTLDAVTAAALRMLGRSVAVRMRDLYGARDVLATFAELDHYGERPDACYVGVIASAPRAIPVAWQHREGLKLLAYLRPAVPGFAAILQGLARLDAEVLCVAPGLAPAAARRLATRHLRIALAPVALPPLLAEADLAIGYGNSGFSTQALLAGVPLLMRPRHVEQAIFAQRVEAVGAGRLLGGPIDADGVAAAVRALLDQPACREAARAFRDRYRHATPERAVEQALDCIERAIPTRRGMRAAKSALPSQEPVEAWRT